MVQKINKQINNKADIGVTAERMTAIACCIVHSISFFTTFSLLPLTNDDASMACTEIPGNASGLEAGIEVPDIESGPENTEAGSGPSL